MPFVANLHPQGVEVDDRVGRLQWPVLPRDDLVDHAVGHRRDQIRRNLDAVQLADVGLDVASAYASSIEDDDLLIDTGESPLILADQHRIGAAPAIARNVQHHPLAAGHSA